MLKNCIKKLIRFCFRLTRITPESVWGSRNNNESTYTLPNTPPQGSLTGKNAFVTGANGSLGRAITAMLISEGAHVYAIGRSKERLQTVVDEMNTLCTGSCTALVVDMSDENAVRKGIQDVLAEDSTMDVWVNCAGGSARGKAAPIHTQHMEIIEDVINSNLRLCIIGSKVAASHMTKQGHGRIINLSSAIADRGKSSFSDYAAAKAGIIGFTRSLALEVGPHGITANCVSPGFIQRGTYNDTQKNYLLRSNCMHAIGKPEDIAHAVVFLASPQAGFITGQNLLVDGGRSLGLMGDN